MDPMEPHALFILRISLAFALIVGLFFLTGLSYIRKGHFAFVSRKGKLLAIWESGFHYALPWTKRISRSYPTGAFDPFKEKEGFSIRIADKERFFHEEKNYRKVLKELRALPGGERKRKALEAFPSMGIEIL